VLLCDLAVSALVPTIMSSSSEVDDPNSAITEFKRASTALSETRGFSDMSLSSERSLSLINRLSTNMSCESFDFDSLDSHVAEAHKMAGQLTPPSLKLSVSWMASYCSLVGH
jgi:hypothetical protein